MIPKFQWKQHQRIRKPPVMHRPAHADRSSADQLPRYVDLRHQMPRIVNQKDMNTWYVLF